MQPHVRNGVTGVPIAQIDTHGQNEATDVPMAQIDTHGQNEATQGEAGAIYSKIYQHVPKYNKK